MEIYIPSQYFTTMVFMKSQILLSANVTFIYSVDHKNIPTSTIFHNNGLYEVTDTIISQGDSHLGNKWFDISIRPVYVIIVET